MEDRTCVFKDIGNQRINYIIMKMNKKTLDSAYQSPVCMKMDLGSEGVLCASYGNEDYEDNVNYDDGTDNKGWY